MVFGQRNPNVWVGMMITFFCEFFLSAFALKGTGRCSLSTLTALLSTVTGVERTDQIQLMQTPDDSNGVLNGSYAVLSCMNGYTNMGGTLNVTCSADGSWSPFPNCVLITDGDSMTGTGARCSVTSPTFNLAYGFPVNTTGLFLDPDNTASGMLMMLIDLEILSCVF